MPKTRFQTVVFTLVTAWLMVYGMTLYNTVLGTGEFTNSTFLHALTGMWVEFVIIFLCACFIAGNVAKYLAFRVVQPGDRPIFIIFAIQIFTVIAQVFFARIMDQDTRFYKSVFAAIHDCLLQKFYNGAALAADHSRTACKAIIQKHLLEKREGEQPGNIRLRQPRLRIRRIL